MPLALIETNREVEILDFQCGNRCNCRLQEMGIVRGCRYRVTCGDGIGPMILSDGRNRIGIGRGLASKVLVREVADA